MKLASVVEQHLRQDCVQPWRFHCKRITISIYGKLLQIYFNSWKYSALEQNLFRGGKKNPMWFGFCRFCKVRYSKRWGNNRLTAISPCKPPQWGWVNVAQSSFSNMTAPPLMASSISSRRSSFGDGSKNDDTRLAAPSKLYSPMLFRQFSTTIR